MNYYAIDTNVLVGANDNSPQLHSDDIVKCKEFILSVYENDIIVLDDKFLIIDEYFKNVNRSGQPGLGDRFAKYLWENQFNVKVCDLVSITPYNNNTEFYELNLPENLRSFDLSDRKFLAVCKASQKNTQICNASDSDWWDYSVKIADFGISIYFICPIQLQNWKVNKSE
ncbi:hypothetical protein AB3N59_20255 (plasmid) [Leptospira sp. WS92.C1]